MVSHEPNESLNSSSRQGTNYSAKGSKIMNEGGEKLKNYKIWLEEKLGKVIYEIKNIPYKLAAINDNIGILPVNKKREEQRKYPSSRRFQDFCQGASTREKW